MLDNIRLRMFFSSISRLFLEQSLFELLEPKIQALWEKKSKQFRSPDQVAREVYERAGIYSEFGRIICISVGLIKGKDPFTLRLKSFYGEDEKLILSDFSAMLTRFCKTNKEATLCAHNGKEFDYPYIARRMIINGLVIPEILDNSGKKAVGSQAP